MKHPVNELGRAYDVLNKKFFDGKLPGCIILVQECKEKGVHGFFKLDSVKKDDKFFDEITISFLGMSFDQKMVLQTLLHEMCHQWQYRMGRDIPKNGNHNLEWVKKMRKCGLIASSTGKPGGKQTGKKMADYPEPDGIFEKFYAEEFDKGIDITLRTRAIELGDEKPKAKPRTKQVTLICPECKASARTKEGNELECLSCNQEMVLKETTSKGKRR